LQIFNPPPFLIQQAYSVVWMEKHHNLPKTNTRQFFN
jgi:hypothetical protein